MCWTLSLHHERCTKTNSIMKCLCNSHRSVGLFFCALFGIHDSVSQAWAPEANMPHVTGKKALVQSRIAESSGIWSDCSVVLNNVEHIFSIIASSDCCVTDNLWTLRSSSQFPPTKWPQIYCVCCCLSICLLFYRTV